MEEALLFLQNEYGCGETPAKMEALPE